MDQAAQVDSTSLSSRPRFKCTAPGCDRGYSRLEHLQRHQLNHNPKDVYRCFYPGCKRYFVRRDLLARHLERHDNPTRSGPLRQAPNQEHLMPVSYSTISNNHTSGLDLVSSTTATDPPQAYSRNTNSSTHTDTFQDTEDCSNANEISATECPEPPCDMLDGEISGEDLALSQDLQARVTFNASATQDLRTFPIEGDYPMSSVEDEFTTWLFDSTEGLQTMSLPTQRDAHLSLLDTTRFMNGVYTSTHVPSFGPFAEPSAVAIDLPAQLEDDQDIQMERRQNQAAVDAMSISTEIWQLLIDTLLRNFNGGNAALVGQEHLNIFQGDVTSEEHVLSYQSVQRYLEAYWTHFHPQRPFLHKPTFCPESVHEYLLLAVIMVGVTHTKRRHETKSQSFVKTGLADLIACHLRRQLAVTDAYELPVKVWLLQTLFLLETYEYSSSSRKLHERSYIHHATIINLMRRGIPFNEAAMQPTQRPGVLSEWWNQWIAMEETRRIVFTIFLHDILYATVFGHTVTFSAHEIKLALPCNDTIWSASTATEVAQLEATLQSSDVRSISFTEAMRRTLLGQKITTDHFGRIIIASGLLSIAWHLGQRDARVSNVSEGQTTNGLSDSWRPQISTGYDFWKREFDNSLEQRRLFLPPVPGITSTHETPELTETAQVLYHISHVVMCVDLVDCEAFTGATKILGQDISSIEYAKVHSRMLTWAEADQAKSGVFHAIKLLRSVFTSPETGQKHLYIAGNDDLFLRPWTLYCAALVLCSYCIASDESRSWALASEASNEFKATTSALNAQQHSYVEIEAVFSKAQRFLLAEEFINTPEHINFSRSSFQDASAMILYLAHTFRDSTWELLREASERLYYAAQFLE